jgi:hypothetical protein
MKITLAPILLEIKVVSLLGYFHEVKLRTPDAEVMSLSPSVRDPI